jgi:transcription elongation factor SPT5
MNEVPQRLLMPSVHDASLWQVRVKVSLLILSGC